MRPGKGTSTMADARHKSQKMTGTTLLGLLQRVSEYPSSCAHHSDAHAVRPGSECLDGRCESVAAIQRGLSQSGGLDKVSEPKEVDGGTRHATPELQDPVLYSLQCRGV